MSQALLDQALEICAVTGPFSPNALVTVLDGDPASSDVLWRGLSDQVSEVLTPSFAWSLNGDTRRDVLSRFTTDAQIKTVLKRAHDLPAEDEFGQFLRQFLQGRAIKVDSGRYRDTSEGIGLELARAGAMLDAIQFAQIVPALDAESLRKTSDAIKHHIIELQRRRDLTVVLPERHFGYEPERERISAFLRGAGPDDEQKPMFLSGLGGMGKSALVARIFKYWQRRNGAPITVILDFDRRQLNAGAPEELFKEFLRQTAAGIEEKGFAPSETQAISSGLRAMRQGIFVSSDSFGAQRSYHAQIDAIEARLPQLMDDSWAQLLLDHPIAVLFDTFEALEWSDSYSIHAVLEFEDLLRRFFPRLRSLVAGREEPLPDDEMEVLFGGAGRRVRLSGIDVPDAVRLLEEEDSRLAQESGARKLTQKAFNTKIAELTEGNPLALLMLVRDVHSHPDALGELKEAIKSNQWVGAQFAQKFTYERTLSRIDNREVRKLAHPGLILHQINADLIRFVLAEPCFGPETRITEEKAQALLQGLGKEYWLVQDGSRGFDLRHRPDLRLLMVPSLFAEPLASDRPEEKARKQDLARKAHDVCKKAVRYFRKGPPAKFTNARRRWEEMPAALREAYALYYHALPTKTDPPKLTKPVAREMNRAFGEEWSLLTRKWQVQVEALLEERVAQDDLDMLSEEQAEAVQKKTYAQESRVGRSARGRFSKQEAEELVRDAKERARIDPSSFGHDLARLFGAAQFESLSPPDIETYLEEILGPDYEKHAVEAQRVGLWNQPFWGAALLHIKGLPAPSGYRAAQDRLMALADSALDDKTRKQRVLAKKHTKLRRKAATTDWLAHPLDRYRYDVGPLWTAAGAKNRTLSFDPSVLCLAVSGRPEEVSKALRRHMPEVAEVSSNILKERGTSLRDLDELYAKARRASVTLRRGAVVRPKISSFFGKMMRGLTPELYEPLASVLTDLPDDAIENTIAELARRSRYFPVEFAGSEKQVFGGAVALSLVEAVDRVGQLRPFMHSLWPVDEANHGMAFELMIGMYDIISEGFFAPCVPHLTSFRL